MVLHYTQRTAQYYIDNFLEVVSKRPENLTTLGFNEDSDIKFAAYKNYFRFETWVDFLKQMGKYEDLLEYMKQDVKTHKYRSPRDWRKKNKYITDELLIKCNKQELLQELGFNKRRYTKSDLKQNIRILAKQLGHFPLYTEFHLHSKISWMAYQSAYGFKRYPSLVQYFLQGDEYLEYEQNRLRHKASVGKITGAMCATHSDEDLEQNFRAIFDQCYNEYGVYPSSKYFARISKIDERTYRQRLKLSWHKICEFYGYKVNREANKAERIVLKNISEILGENYISQYSPPWLVGAGGGRMRCDGYYPINNLVVEFDGRQHKQPIDKYGGEQAFERLKENDRVKEELLMRNGIRVLRITSEEEWHSKDHLKCRVGEIIGKD